MFDWIFVIFHPSCWLLKDGLHYSPELDSWLKKALDDPTLEESASPSHKGLLCYKADINGQIFWVANDVFSFELDETNLRPSRKTAYLTMRAIKQKRNDLRAEQIKSILKAHGVIAE